MDITIEKFLSDGFTIKMAKYFSELLENERKSGLWDKDYIDWAHNNGFLAESASAYGLNKNNIKDYLSDYNYYKIWPLNSWERIWINDKLTLKYMLSGTEYDAYMPKYYYYTDSKKGLIPLIDNENTDNTLSSFIDTLKKQKIFAAKPCNGSGSQGFYKIEYINGSIVINGEEYSNIELQDFLKVHSNFVFTEYLLPEKSMKRISPLIHTLRVVVVNENGNPFILGGYLRFANSTTGAANHMTGVSREEFDVDTTVDFKTGKFSKARAVGIKEVRPLVVHPDNGEVIEGFIPNYNELLKFIYGFAKKYSLCEYLGFDLCVADNGIKLMEINSHPGIRHMQLASPLMADEKAKAYFENKILEVQNLDEQQIHIRKNCWR